MWRELALLLLFLSAYSYFLYPLLLLALRLAVRKTVAAADFTPRISLIIAVYNEEQKIREKLANTLALDYPPDKLEIIVTSDASTDRTEDIVREHPGLVLCRSEARLGKEHAQRNAIQRATGEVLVFTDAGTLLDKDALRILARNFADPSVGAVSSTDKMISEGGSGGEGFYVRYEMLLRRLESETGGLVGLSGSFFSARKQVCEGWPEDLASDFNTVFLSLKKGLVAVADDRVVGYYKDIKKGQSEYSRKVRTLIRGITVFMRTLEALNVFKYGLFSWKLFSHKLMRWLVPAFLIALLGVSAAGAAAGDPLCQGLLAAQVLFYLLALLAWLVPASQRLLPVKIVYFFVNVNIAVLLAWIRYLRGERLTTWNPSKR